MDKTRTILTFDHPISAESVKVDPVVWDMLNKTKVMGVTYNQSDDALRFSVKPSSLLGERSLHCPRIYVQRDVQRFQAPICSRYPAPTLILRFRSCSLESAMRHGSGQMDLA